VQVDSGNGPYSTDAVHLTETGWYTWVADYSGDDNNKPAVHGCGVDVETVHVTPRQPEISTQVSASQLVLTENEGAAIFHDTATLSGGTDDPAITGTISFSLYGPLDAAPNSDSCTESNLANVDPNPMDVSVDHGNGDYLSPNVQVTEPGFYTWRADYQGDLRNLGASHECGLPAETVQVLSGPNPGLDKTSDPASGSVVQPGSQIDYTVTVNNTGDVAINEGVVTDILPAHVTIIDGTIDNSGTDNGDGTITWLVDLAPGESLDLHYSVTVDQDAPPGSTLVNTAKFFNLQATTTHRVPTGKLTIVKEVSPAEGDGTVVQFGDTLTYTLTASATGNLDQPQAVITDFVPGFDPDITNSGTTTYVAGSATCDEGGDCVVTEPSAGNGHLITWELGTLKAGTSRSVTFQVTIDRPPTPPDTAASVDIFNAGAVESLLTPKTPSNKVHTPVTEVLAVQPHKPPAGELPKTGATLPIGPVVGTAVALLGLGVLLLVSSRRREWGE
jgi:uncharacterized repeat protein (TIGR01451 family)/LPXTG-motif cell wall-anchored protein